MNRSRDLKSDDRGDMLGLPLELLIIVVVMALSIPMIYGFADHYVENQVDTSTRMELRYLIEEAEVVFERGLENQRIVTLSIEDHFFAEIQFIEIGGRGLRDMSTIRYGIEERRNTIDLDGMLLANVTDSRPDKIRFRSGDASLFLRRATVDGLDIVEIGWTEGGVDR